MDFETPQDFIAQLCNRTPPSSESVLAMYLELINAPSDLEGIVFVTEQFQSLYPLIVEIGKVENVTGFLTIDQLHACKKVADIIVYHKTDITKRFPQTIRRSNSEKALYGIYKKHPAYSCIGVSAAYHRGDRRHMILEAYIIIATSVLRRRQGTRLNSRGILEFDEAMVGGCRLARQLLLKPKQDTLNNLADKIHNVAGEYVKDAERGGEPLRKITHLLKCGLEGESAPTYNRNAKRKTFTKIHHTINDSPDPDTVGKGDRVDILRSCIRQATKNLDPQESGSGVEFLQVKALEGPPMEGRSSSQHTLRQRSYLQSIAMHNQRLPMIWEQLTLHEVSLFLEAVQLLAEHRYPINFKSNYYGKLDHLAVSAYAVTMFLRSLSSFDTGDFRVSNGEYKQVAPPGYRYYPDKSGCWIAQAPDLGLDTTLGNSFYSNAERKREFFYLSSGTGLEAIVDEYLRTIVKPGPYKCNLFPKEGWLYFKTFQELLTDLNVKHKTRLTVKRIGSYLYNMLSRQDGGDLTTAMLLTGKYDFLGESPLHYTAIPVAKLQKMYHSCCTGIMSQHIEEMVLRSPELTPTIPAKTPLYHSWNGTAGTPYRPRKSAVRKLIKKLQNRMVQLNDAPRSLDKFLRMHNNIMRYTAIMFAFSTGFRAVTSPLLPPSQIDDSTGFAVISDKDGLDYYNSRIVWLPLVCIRQYRLYIDHLEAMLPKLEFLDLEIFNSLNILFSQDRPEDKLPLFFLLDKHGDSTVIRPTDLWQNIRDNLQYDLPANASRHYLRSNLLERGCPHEVISAFMGHWERGEEPWGRNSALCPTNYAATLSGYLVPLLEEDGWKPFAGIQELW